MGDAMYRIGEAITVGYNLNFDGYRYLQTYGPVVHNFLNGQMQYDWMGVPTNDTEITPRCASKIEAALDARSGRAGRASHS